ncbi:hypothetical protein [Bosea sp. (in: a-proteobacteria)]|uniref:hypothetical protein n=1 Tax=Bosea sp. (in: a-proteobacteria) TaxID=1871050 RepID=UPI002733C03D|nr:hypothetical protein [Bosea sp. (in: a-proteobacteria)]MDP3407283.1 hypothetical protein [Bosea sp. (in: a-proteobacteria)]
MTAARLRHRFSAAIALTALALVQPVAAADFQLDNVRLDFGAVVISAPRLMVKGSSLEREAFRALLDTRSSESAVARIDRLNASEITAPELVFEHSLGQQKQATTYRDVRFSAIRDGVVGRGEAAGGTLSGENPQSGKITGTLQRMGFEGLDLRQTARVMTERATPGGNEPARPLVRRFEQDGYTVDMGAAGQVSLGKMIGRDFGARVGEEPLGEVFNRAMSLAAEVAASETKPGSTRPGSTRPGAARPNPTTGDAEKRMGEALLALYDRIDYGSGDIRDMTMTVVDPTPAGRPGVKPEPVTVKIARIAYGDDAAAKSGFSVEGLQFAGGGAKGLIDSISYSGFSYGPVIKALREDLARPSAGADAFDWRRYIPTLGTMRLAGLSVDAPPMLPGGQPIKIGLGTFELKAGEQLNGIPTSLVVTVDKLLAPISEGTGNPAARDLIAMGIRSLDLSAKIDLAWEAARNELAIRQIAFGGAGLARLEASATLGNVTKDLFSNDMALAQVAALGATARGLTAKLENFGLVEKLIANEARKAGRRPDEMRQQFAMIASLGLASILGPSDAAKTLTAAVSRFAAKPGTLTLDARAKSASGLGLADVITITDPTELLDKIDLKADSQ